MVRDRKKAKLLNEVQELWKQQTPNEIGAVAMIREDRDAR